MRIALIEFPPSGGLYQFAVQLGSALAQQDHRVALVTGPRPEIVPDVPGLRVLPVLPTWHPTAGADAPEWWRRARRGVRAGQHALAWAYTVAWLRRHRPDAVMWSSWRFGLDGLGVQLTRRALPNTVLALVAHEPVPLVEQPGSEALEKETGGLDSPLGRAYRTLDVAFVLGDKAREVLQRVWQPSAPVEVIPHGTEEVFLGDGPVAPVAGTAAHVLFFGTITGYKGLPDLLRVWPRVREEVPEATLTVAGGVSADTDLPALTDQVSRMDGVELRAGYVASEEVRDLFQAARVVALPYRRSSQSGVAHLAQTFGRPVVTTRVGDIPTVVRDGISGWVVPPGDDDALVAALVEVLRSPEEAARRGEVGREELLAQASWSTVAERVADALLRAQRTRRGEP